MRSQPHRLIAVKWAGIAALVAAAVFASPAFGVHYHITGWYGGSGHALMHGDRTDDEVWHGRTTPAQVTGTHYCAVGDQGRGLVVIDKNNTLGNCTATVRRDQFIYGSAECKSYAWARYDNAAIDPHNHYSHVGCYTPA